MRLFPFLGLMPFVVPAVQAQNSAPAPPKAVYRTNRPPRHPGRTWT
jgi:hypothetical protein